MEWLVASSLLVPTSAILIWPLWRHSDRPLPAGVEGILEETDQERKEEKKRLLANLRLLRLHYAEGKVAKEDFQELETEYQQQLAVVLNGSEQVRTYVPVKPRPGLHHGGSAALLLLVSATSLLLFNHYWKVAPATAQPTQELNADAMVQRLEARLAANPNDIEGQMMMARSYTALGRSNEALKAWNKVLELEPENSEVSGNVAVMLLQTGGETEVREALKLIARLRQTDPAEPGWLWYQSMGEDLLGQRDEARATLEELLPMLPPESEKAAMVREALAQMTSAR